MAKIHILPAQPHGVDQFERLRADLAAAHARGADLGSRARTSRPAANGSCSSVASSKRPSTTWIGG